MLASALHLLIFGPKKLHAKNVKGKPMQEALNNMPKGVEKKQCEWLVTKHFTSKGFQV